MSVSIAGCVVTHQRAQALKMHPAHLRSLGCWHPDAGQPSPESDADLQSLLAVLPSHVQAEVLRVLTEELPKGRELGPVSPFAVALLSANNGLERCMHDGLHLHGVNAL